MYDFLIVGAGFTGATAARLLADRGYRVAVIDRRDHLGGNCADVTQSGILRNLHGGHIFHTNSDRVWQFVNRFGAWQQYTHRVAACVEGLLYSFPINLLTLSQLYGAMTSEEAAQVAEEKRGELVDMFFRGYSEKQWGRPFEEIPGGVAARVPWRTSYDDRYFTDKYQGLPEGGYSCLIGNMLRGVPVLLGDDFKRSVNYWLRNARRVIFTGGLDELLHSLGIAPDDLPLLDYRSLTFEDHTMEGDFQGCATVNYPSRSVPFTRILEWKHYGWQKAPSTIYTFETPAAYVPGENEPYYPVRDEKNTAVYARYVKLAAGLPWLIPAGRLGAYQYLNMDQAIASAMALVERTVGGDD